MDQAAAASRSRSRVLSEIDPHSEWIHGDEFDTLVLDVTGFSKDHLKVQVEASGSLRISGERAVNGGGRHWLHFLKRFDLPPGAAGDASAIKVQLDKGVLYVQVPRPGAPAAAAAATTGSDGEQQQQEEGEIAGGACRRAAARRGGQQLAGALSRHRQVVLNVVIAVVLLWLVTFANKPTKNE
uniref:SHSP domain-containing protein n=1 Tax=Oryza meridionalis TaxID=40149 RepID=A0A0E0DCJ0_9ORYZ